MSESSQDETQGYEAAGRQAEVDARQLVLIKKGQRYVFRYEEGQEAQILAHLADLVRSGQSDLDWFDAAVLSHQMGRRLGDKLERAIKPSPSSDTTE